MKKREKETRASLEANLERKKAEVDEAKKETKEKMEEVRQLEEKIRVFDLSQIEKAMLDSKISPLQVVEMINEAGKQNERLLNEGRKHSYEFENAL